MHFTTKMKVRALLRSIFKIIFFPIFIPLALLGWMYKGEKKKLIEEVIEDDVDEVVGLSKDGLMLSGQHRLKQFVTAQKLEPTDMGQVSSNNAATKHFVDAANKSATELLSANKTEREEFTYDHRRKGRAYLILRDANQRILEHIEIAGNSFTSSLEHGRFLATVKVNRAYQPKAVELANWKGEVIAIDSWDHEHVQRGDVINLEMIIQTSQKALFQESMLSWRGEPLGSLDDGHLFNIVMAVDKGEWVSGKKASISPPMAKALKEEYARRQFTLKDVDKFYKRNNLWEEKRERPNNAQARRDPDPHGFVEYMRGGHYSGFGGGM